MKLARDCCYALVLPGLLSGCVHYQVEPLSPGRVAAEFEERSLSDPGLKTFLEQKPFYLDLESSVLVETLAKAIRRSAEEFPGASVSLSEMLPGHDQIWLPDAQNNHYTCELRLVTLDLD